MLGVELDILDLIMYHLTLILYNFCMKLFLLYTLLLLIIKNDKVIKFLTSILFSFQSLKKAVPQVNTATAVAVTPNRYAPLHEYYIGLLQIGYAQFQSYI